MPGYLLALNILLAAASDAAFALLAGSLLAVRWLTAAAAHTAPAAVPRSLHRLSLVCVSVLAASQTVHPWFVASSMSGSGGFAANLALVPDILTSTHQGKLWFLQMAAILALFVCSVRTLRAQKPGGLRLPAICLFLMACAKAASGHAANEGDFTLEELSMLLHIVGTAVWAGTVIVSGLLVLPCLIQTSDLTGSWLYARRLSTTVTWALAAIVISGLYTSDRELSGVLSGLWRSGWGRILLGKLAFVAAALALGALTRFRCVQREPSGEAAGLMLRLMRAEALAMITVLCLSGALANTPPAMSESTALRQHRTSPDMSLRSAAFTASLRLSPPLLVR